MTDFVIDKSTDDYQPMEWRCKEYITQELFKLHENNGYKLKV